MNTIQQEVKETDRILKGHEIYNDGLVEKLDNKTFVVKGKYVVEDILSELYTCTCKDFGYRADNINYCKHIHAVLFYILDGA